MIEGGDETVVAVAVAVVVVVVVGDKVGDGDGNWDEVVTSDEVGVSVGRVGNEVGVGIRWG
jgi:hypothetical protein